MIKEEQNKKNEIIRTKEENENKKKIIKQQQLSIKINEILKKEHNLKLITLKNLKSVMTIGKAKSIIFIYNKFINKKINEITSSFLSNELNVDRIYADKLLQDLERLGLLTKTKNGKYNVYIIEEIDILKSLIDKAIKVIKDNEIK